MPKPAPWHGSGTHGKRPRKRHGRTARAKRAAIRQAENEEIEEECTCQPGFACTANLDDETEKRGHQT